jgi:hypothetical protein
MMADIVYVALHTPHDAASVIGVYEAFNGAQAAVEKYAERSPTLEHVRFEWLQDDPQILVWHDYYNEYAIETYSVE